MKSSFYVFWYSSLFFWSLLFYSQSKRHMICETHLDSVDHVSQKIWDLWTFSFGYHVEIFCFELDEINFYSLLKTAPLVRISLHHLNFQWIFQSSYLKPIGLDIYDFKRFCLIRKCFLLHFPTKELLGAAQHIISKASHKAF